MGRKSMTRNEMTNAEWRLPGEAGYGPGRVVRTGSPALSAPVGRALDDPSSWVGAKAVAAKERSQAVAA